MWTPPARVRSRLAHILTRVSSYALPKITVEELPRTGAREDFLIRMVGPGDTDYSFPVSMTYTALGIWQTDGATAAAAFAEVLAELHGTAEAFPDEGFWFDSYRIADSVKATCDLMRERGWKTFLHPAAKESLGAELFNALADLDSVRLDRWGSLFLRSLDVLFEPNQALEDLESEADDHPHFIYRVCILCGIMDRFDFESDVGSLNGLKAWLAELGGEDAASDLTETYFMLRRLRRQYPIHEQYDVDAMGFKSRRSDVLEAETYFGLDGSHAADWKRVRERFIDATRRIVDFMRAVDPSTGL